MPPENPFALPFLNRDMLRFGQTTKFQIQVIAQADEAATLHIHGITREGQFTYKLGTNATAATLATGTFGIADIPIMISVEDGLAAFEQGQCFVVINLLANGETIQQLTSGYVYGKKALSWPQTQQVDLRPGGGRLYSYTGVNQAAGVEITETVPTGEIWRLIAMDATLSCSATVASRRPHLELFDPGGGNVHVYPNTDQTASQTLSYYWHKSGAIQADADNSEIVVALPQEMFIGPGGTISTQTKNFQAGDNWFAPHLTVEKFFTTP